MVIRDEREPDWPSVRALNRAAFETAAEAVLVDTLRRDAQPVVSLVAEQDAGIVGHVLFSPVTLHGHPRLELMGLAPMAVTPKLQRRGIGTALVEAGIERCKALAVVALVVLGHPRFYSRLGFVRSDRFGIACEYDVPAEAFMVRELQAGRLAGKHGLVAYHAAFSTL